MRQMHQGVAARSLAPSMSYSAKCESRRAGEHMQSPMMLLANTVLPAPMKAIFGIVVSSSMRGLVVGPRARDVPGRRCRGRGTNAPW